MNRRMDVKGAEIRGGSLFLSAAEAVEGLVPKGQMLVDTDNLSFVYLMENNDEYTYVILPETVWPTLKEGLDQNLPVFLVNGEGSVELNAFNEELAYLAENIKGNGNYGEAMAGKVEVTF